jgi:hypothetical protein
MFRSLDGAAALADRWRVDVPRLVLHRLSANRALALAAVPSSSDDVALADSSALPFGVTKSDVDEIARDRDARRHHALTPAVLDSMASVSAPLAALLCLFRAPLDRFSVLFAMRALRLVMSDATTTNDAAVAFRRVVRRRVRAYATFAAVFVDAGAESVDDTRLHALRSAITRDVEQDSDVADHDEQRQQQRDRQLLDDLEQVSWC